MDFGLILPSYRDGASTAGIDAAAGAAARLGWHSAFTTDHVLVDPTERAADYFQVFDALQTLAYLAGRHQSIHLGISVVVVPMRNAVLLAKELATLDVLSGGRLICGVGVGWNQVEFGNLGAAERFGRRGAYLDEALAIWRHLWSGGNGPFAGRFHQFDEVRFGPLPVQGAGVPIWVGGRSEATLRRAGRVGDAYHVSATSPAQMAERIPLVAAAAAEAGRPMPLLSARARVLFGSHEGPGYAIAGTPAQMVDELGAWRELGVGHLALDFVDTDSTRNVELIERFDSEVLASFR